MLRLEIVRDFYRVDMPRVHKEAIPELHRMMQSHMAFSKRALEASAFALASGIKAKPVLRVGEYDEARHGVDTYLDLEFESDADGLVMKMWLEPQSS